VARVWLVTTDHSLAFLADFCLTRAGHEVEHVVMPPAEPERLAGPPPHAVVLEYTPPDEWGQHSVTDLHEPREAPHGPPLPDREKSRRQGNGASR